MTPRRDSMTSSLGTCSQEHVWHSSRNPILRISSCTSVVCSERSVSTSYTEQAPVLSHVALQPYCSSIYRMTYRSFRRSLSNTRQRLPLTKTSRLQGHSLDCGRRPSYSLSTISVISPKLKGVTTYQTYSCRIKPYCDSQSLACGMIHGSDLVLDTTDELTRGFSGANCMIIIAMSR
jgi:hypothetical protein